MTLTTLTVFVVLGINVMQKVRSHTDHGGIILTTLFLISSVSGIATVGLNALVGLFF